jgi:hypothetical protein
MSNNGKTIDGRISMEEAARNVAENVALLFSAMESDGSEDGKPKARPTVVKVKPVVSDRKVDKFRRHAEKLIKYLNDEHHPHTTIIITPTSAEILEGVAGFNTSEFVND